MPGYMKFVKGENVADFVLYPLITVFTRIPCKYSLYCKSKEKIVQN